MRPALLGPLFAPAGALPGVGPKNAKLLDKLLARNGRGALEANLYSSAPCICSTVPGSAGD